jgi:hypothetical protein
MLITSIPRMNAEFLIWRPPDGRERTLDAVLIGRRRRPSRERNPRMDSFCEYKSSNAAGLSYFYKIFTTAVNFFSKRLTRLISGFQESAWYTKLYHISTPFMRADCVKRSSRYSRLPPMRSATSSARLRYPPGPSHQDPAQHGERFRDSVPLSQE